MDSHRQGHEGQITERPLISQKISHKEQQRQAAAGAQQEQHSKPIAPCQPKRKMNSPMVMFPVPEVLTL